MFGHRVQLWWDLPLRESFSLLRHIYGVPAERHRQTLQRFSDVLDLDPLLDIPVRQLSLGQRVRGELAAAMLHEPELLFLDEPTIGLDVVVKDRIRAFLTLVREEQEATILLSTHDLADVERLSTRMMILDKGALIYDGTVDQLLRRYGGERTMIVDLQEPRPPLDIPGAKIERVEGVRQWLRFRSEQASAAEIAAAVARSAPIADLAIKEPEIDDVVRSIYTR